VRRWFSKLRRNRRGRCRACSVRENLQWAHRRPTGLSGEGRGSKERVLDIKRNPRAYVLLCLECHRFFDRKILLRPSRGRGWRCDLARASEVIEALEPVQYIYGEEVGNDWVDRLNRPIPEEPIAADVERSDRREIYRTEAREILSRIAGTDPSLSK
jgi:hypothetical protein